MSPDDYRKLCILHAIDGPQFQVSGVGTRASYVIAPTGHNINLDIPWKRNQMCYEVMDGDRYADETRTLYTTNCKGDFVRIDLDDWTYDCCPEHNKGPS